MYKCIIWSDESAPHEHLVNTRSALTAAMEYGRTEGNEIVQIETMTGRVLSRVEWRDDERSYIRVNAPESSPAEAAGEEAAQKQYAVIGGQHRYYSYGVADNLPAAKRLATANAELWSGEGMQYPKIYALEDVVPVEPATDDGHYYDSGYRPKEGARPVAWRRWGGSWQSNN